MRKNIINFECSSKFKIVYLYLQLCLLNYTAAAYCDLFACFIGVQAFIYVIVFALIFGSFSLTFFLFYFTQLAGFLIMIGSQHLITIMVVNTLLCIAATLEMVVLMIPSSTLG